MLGDLSNFEAGQAAFAAALIDPAAPLPAGLTTARGEPDAARFAIYRNNVAVALIKALEGRFPVTRRLVGDDFFRDMARAYIAGTKPASPLIMHYGDDFPDFVAGYKPAGSVTYLADVAQVEAAWTRAYNAADADPIGIAQVAELPPEQLPATRLILHPSAAIVSSPHPIGSIWSAHQGADVQPVSHWRPETVLIARPDLDVAVNVIPTSDAPFARALFAGSTLGEAAESALAADESFDFGTALVGLISLGAFSAMQLHHGADDGHHD